MPEFLFLRPPETATTARTDLRIRPDIQRLSPSELSIRRTRSLRSLNAVLISSWLLLVLAISPRSSTVRQRVPAQDSWPVLQRAVTAAAAQSAFRTDP